MFSETRYALSGDLRVAYRTTTREGPRDIIFVSNWFTNCEALPEHTGECEVRGDDVGGICGAHRRRVSALAGPGEILVSGTLRDLVVGSGLQFADRGPHELKGVPGDWRLFAVDA